MPPEMNQQGSRRTTALGVGAIAAMVLCCVGPILLAGGFLSSPLVVMSGLGLVGAALAVFLRRHTRSTDQSCCPPGLDQGVGRFDAAPLPATRPKPTAPEGAAQLKKFDS
jgi:hypothetical protein